MLLEKQRHKISRGKIWKFFGGLTLKDLKQTNKDGIEDLKLPNLITLPVDRHLGKDGRLLVTVGERVKRGQQLTEPNSQNNNFVPLHASTSGTIMSIGPQVLPHPSGFSGCCISIRPDGLDEAVEPKPLPKWEQMEISALLSRIREFGVEGLGGAQFPTAAKLQAALDENKTEYKILIINGCECEPMVTCDDRLIQEKTDDILLGIRILKKILNPAEILIAIEDNKPHAIDAIRNALESHRQHFGEHIGTLRVLPTKYPQGAARNLIRTLTGFEIPYQTHTAELGIVVQNVSTVYAIKQVIVDGMPLDSRVITVRGDSLAKQGNIRVRFGTSVRFILNNFKLKPEFHQRIILGGPMMGFTLPSIDVPITKSVNCLIAPAETDLPQDKSTHNCIRCGRCARVCPSRLVPYQIYAASKAVNHALARKCGIADCNECGCCAYICPSGIDLTAQFRREHAIQKLISEMERRNATAKERMAIHDERVRLEEEKKAAKRAAALARIKQQKQQSTNSEDEQSQTQIAPAPQPIERPVRDTTKEQPELNKLSAVTHPAEAQEQPEIATLPDPKQKPKVPYNLRHSAAPKHVQPYAQWQKPTKHVPDLSLVGIEHSTLCVPEAAPKKAQFLHQAEDNQPEPIRIPEALKKNSSHRINKE